MIVRPLLRLAPALVLLASVLASATATAGDLLLPGRGRILSATLTQSLIGEYHVDNDPVEGNPAEKYFDIKNRTEIVLLHGTTSFNLRFDATGFIGTLDGSRHQDRISLEKISLSSVQRAFDVGAGDFYVKVGRLALDMTRVDQLASDTTLRGGILRLRSRYVDGLLFGGWVNPLDMDDFSEVPMRIPSDVIGGARLEVRPMPALRVGLQYVGAGLEPNVGVSRNATHILGGTIELPSLARRLSLYAEFDYMSRAQGLEIIHGHGTYFGGSGNFGPLAVLLEFKLYREFDLGNSLQGKDPSQSDTNIYGYLRPPTLMHKKAEVLNNANVIGPRLKLDLRLQSLGTILFASYGRFHEPDPGGDFFSGGINIDDLYAGFQQPLPGGALDVSGGWRRDLRDDQGTAITNYSQIFAEAEASFQIRAGQTLELEVQFRKTEKAAKEFSDFFIGVGYRPSRYFSGGVQYEWSNEFKAPEQNPEGFTVRNHFGAVRATVNFTPSSFARILGGTTRGGVRCLDGYCREFPPFIGVKMEVVVQL